MRPAKRIPAAIPAITGLFIVAIENYIVVKKYYFFRCLLLVDIASYFVYA
jgi:hypothetical protein